MHFRDTYRRQSPRCRALTQTTTDGIILGYLNSLVRSFFADLDRQVRLVGEDIIQILATDEAGDIRHFEGAQKPLLVTSETREPYALQWSRLLFTGAKAASIEESPL